MKLITISHASLMVSLILFILIIHYKFLLFSHHPFILQSVSKLLIIFYLPLYNNACKICTILIREQVIQIVKNAIYEIQNEKPWGKLQERKQTKHFKSRYKKARQMNYQLPNEVEKTSKQKERLQLLEREEQNQKIKKQQQIEKVKNIDLGKPPNLQNITINKPNIWAAKESSIRLLTKENTYYSYLSD